MMDYQILALDLDGTLTNSKKEITPQTKEALIRIQENGIKVVLASGRQQPASFPLQKNCSWNALEATFSPSTADASPTAGAGRSSTTDTFQKTLLHLCLKSSDTLMSTL